jgi:thymidylate kinase
MNIAQKYFSFLNENNIDYVVVGDTKNYPEVIESDIDIVVKPVDLPLMRKLLYRFCEDNSDLNLVQILQHEQTASYYVVAKLNKKSTPVYLHPDICSHYYRNGVMLLSAKEMLYSRVEAVDDTGRGKGFYVPSPKMEFIYYLLKKIDKQKLSNSHGTHLNEEWRKDPSGCMKEISRFWNGSEVEMLRLAAETNEWAAINDKLLCLQKSLHRAFTFSIMAWWKEVSRKVNRVLRPTGLLVVFLGPDGSGKSSVIEKIIPDLAPVFRRTQYLHLRPNIGKRCNGNNNAPVDDPHCQNPRNWFVSVIKVIYFLFDYNVGYVLKIRPMLVRSTLVVFDRYYHDILVDPKRYRYASPVWFSHVIGKLIPKPDLFILLDASVEVLQGRKQEVSYEETARQRKEYLKLISEVKNGVVIDGEQPLEKVVADVNKAVLDYMRNRTEHRIG